MPDELTASMTDAMWALFDTYYLGTPRPHFEADFRKKDVVFLVREGDRLVGFNSIKRIVIDGERVLTSGDLVMAAEARGLASAALFRAWAAAVRGSCDWWCSLASGPRTFRLPFLFFHRVSPDAGGGEHPEERDRKDRFARAAYGGAYDSGTGVVRLPRAYVLRPETDILREGYPLDDLFRARNPGWDRGDELVSLVSLRPENWNARARRLLREASA